MGHKLWGTTDAPGDPRKGGLVFHLVREHAATDNCQTIEL